MQPSRVEEGQSRRPVCPIEIFKSNLAVRLFKNLVTDSQLVYRDAKADFTHSVFRFDKCLDDANLLLVNRVHHDVTSLLFGQEGQSPFVYE